MFVRTWINNVLLWSTLRRAIHTLFSRRTVCQEFRHCLKTVLTKPGGTTQSCHDNTRFNQLLMFIYRAVVFFSSHEPYSQHVASEATAIVSNCPRVSSRFLEEQARAKKVDNIGFLLPNTRGACEIFWVKFQLCHFKSMFGYERYASENPDIGRFFLCLASLAWFYTLAYSFYK